ncbi:Hypothetical protein PHPALM_8138 [Phytophthora palmivora]|uniref:Uncharacterized protein n=1 Tax=Phytophthora palmivora TaxID=4796 RepID=A0A2P4YAM5_9STRA|nr:Hypothetical protein PHPALM_8138 [Phytophthora palmivora]
MTDAPQPRRTLSRESCVQPRETESAFAAFLSDGSSDEDEEDADSRALLRMQQQADDSAYCEAPFQLESSVSTDVVDLMTLVERVTVLSDAVDGETRRTTCRMEDEPQRKTSSRETESAFADFLSDGSSDEDEEDADARAVLRMQQQEDDRMFLDTSLKMDRETSNSSFRLTLAKPDLDDDMGPRKLVEAMKRGAEVVENQVNTSREEDRPSFNEVHSFTGPDIRFLEDTPDSSASRPPSFEDEDSFFDEPRPSFSDEPSFTGGDSFTDNSFVYRPSLPDEEDIQNTQQTTTSFVDASFVYRPSLPDDVHTNKELPGHAQSTSDIIDNSFVYRPTLPSEEAKKIDTETNDIAVSTESKDIA